MADHDCEFLTAFANGDVVAATAALTKIETVSSYQAHPLLRQCVSQHDGHCYAQKQLLIADLLIPNVVQAFRAAIIEDRTEDVRDQLNKDPSLVHSEFTAGRGIAQGIHHWCSIPVAELLLLAGADINARNTVHLGETPLAMQVRFGTLEGVRFLLERGADPNLGERMHMPSEIMPALIPLLLNHGWDIQTGNQLLHDANHGHAQRVRLWLQHGVDSNQANEAGQTALHLLAARGSGSNAIRLLVGAGADLNCQDQAGQTPLDLARRAKRQAAAQELIRLGSQEL